MAGVGDLRIPLLPGATKAVWRVRIHTSSFLCLFHLFTSRSSLPFALCAVLPILTKVSHSLLAFHLALRHSHSSTSSSSGRFLAVAVRPCNAAGTVASPLVPPTPPLLHRCSCNSNGGGRNGRRTLLQRQRGNYEVVAALVHLVVRGRDIGLPRSTLPVRYSFPASLMHYTRLSASRPCVVVLPVPALRLSLSISIVSVSLVVFSPSSPLPYPFSACLSTSICLPFCLFSLVHLVPADLPVAPCSSLVLLFASFSFCLSAMRWRRMDKAHRHHAISFIAADPPRIQIVAEPEMTTERRKRLQTGAQVIMIVTVKVMVMATATENTATIGNDCRPHDAYN